MDDRRILITLQLSDTGFPTGGFSHSAGLEAAVRYHHVTSPETLEVFLLCALENAGSFSLPFTREAYGKFDDIDSVKCLDKLCEACTTNHVAKRASVRQGRAMMESVQKTTQDKMVTALWSSLDHGHHAVVFGAVCGALGLGLRTSQDMFMFGVVRTVMGSAVRLDIVGPLQAQEIQYRLQENIPDIMDRNAFRTSEEASLVFPNLDITQNCQDSLYSKLFYS